MDDGEPEIEDGEGENFELSVKQMMVNQNRKKKKSGGFQVMGEKIKNFVLRTWGYPCKTRVR